MENGKAFSFQNRRNFTLIKELTSLEAELENSGVGVAAS
jgi:hypothetical protein